MANITFEELIQAVHQLKPEQKRALIQTLQPEIGADDDQSLTRGQALAELEALRLAGAFEHVESLYGKYARSGVQVGNDELNDYLHQIGNEWEQDLDDLSDTH
jgi:hypothetical protein